MVQKAKNRVKAKSNGHGQLHLTIPKNLQLKELADDGLLIPGRMDDREAYAPLDFTSISSREVGRQHSMWAVRHAHLIFLVGNLRAEIGNVKYDLKNAEARWMLRHQGEYKNKWEAEHAAGRNKDIRNLRKLLVRAEGSLARYEALATSYQSLMTAASREIARRSEERNTHD